MIFEHRFYVTKNELETAHLIFSEYTKKLLTKHVLEIQQTILSISKMHFDGFQIKK